VAEGDRGGNEQIKIYFSQIHIYSLNDIMYNEYHEYPLIAAAEYFV